jgi:hypothetical protein
MNKDMLFLRNNPDYPGYFFELERLNVILATFSLFPSSTDVRSERINGPCSRKNATSPAPSPWVDVDTCLALERA